MSDLISKYFSSLPAEHLHKLDKLEELYAYWNRRINLISRKDMDSFVLHHVIHSLSVGQIIRFKKNTVILDAGTGGGFPGIPLAIVFPECKFVLVDSIKKKIQVVENIADSLGLKNISTKWSRVEHLNIHVDFVVSRAVAPFPDLYKWTSVLIHNKSFNDLPNGIIALKGGDLSEELKDFPSSRIYNLRDYFEEKYFGEKKIVYLEL